LPLLGGLLIWLYIVPGVVLYMAKAAATREFADEYANSRAVLNAVPRSKKLGLANNYTNTVWLNVGGCPVGFPAEFYTPDTNPKRKNVVLHHAHYRVLVLPGDDAKEFGEVMQSLNETNLYELVLKAFNATEKDILKQRSMSALEKHVNLLKLKEMMSCLGFEHSCIQFDRGDLKGFIIGNPACDKEVFIRVFIEGGQKCIDLSVIQSERGHISDFEEMVSVVKVGSK
jgi:hypothetical protein